MKRRYKNVLMPFGMLAILAFSIKLVELMFSGYPNDAVWLMGGIFAGLSCMRFYYEMRR